MTKEELLKKVVDLNNKKQKKTKSHIRISNNIIESKLLNSNLISFKTLLYISMIDKKDIDYKNTTETKYILSLHHIQKTFNINRQTLKDNIYGMLNSSIVFSDNNDIFHAISMINEMKINYSDKTMTITINNKILKEIINLKNKYTLIEHLTAFQLKNKHSLKIYSMLSHISGYSEEIAKTKTYSLEEMNLLLGTNYKSYSQFKINVLNKVHNELNDISDISFINDKNIIIKDLVEGKIKNIGFRFIIINNKNRQGVLDI